MSKPTYLHTVELRLSDEEYQRVKLIATCQNITPAKVYRRELNFLIQEGVFDEMLTGHE